MTPARDPGGGRRLRAGLRSLELRSRYVRSLGSIVRDFARSDWFLNVHWVVVAVQPAYKQAPAERAWRPGQFPGLAVEEMNRQNRTVSETPTPVRVSPYSCWVGGWVTALCRAPPSSRKLDIGAFSLDFLCPP